MKQNSFTVSDFYFTFIMKKLIKRAAKDLSSSKHAIALTGAGMSTESGIPDFRGPDGIWTKDPEAERKAYDAYELFKKNPKEFWEQRLDPNSALRRMFEMFGQLDDAKPNPGHFALAGLEEKGILKYILTQNVDGLHQKAGSKKVAEYHGAIRKFRCIDCANRFVPDELDLNQLSVSGKLPPLCECGGIIKDDGVFFGEPIPNDVRNLSEQEALKCDVMLICGTSAVVQPFASLPNLAKYGENKSVFGLMFTGDLLKKKVTIIEINAEPTHLTNGISDYLIQGKTGEILPKIAEKI